MTTERGKARLEQLVWDAAHSRRAVAAAAGALLVVCFIAAVATRSPLAPASIAYAVPVSLAALALGTRAGIAAALVGAVLYWLGAYLDGRTLTAGYLSYRLLALL